MSEALQIQQEILSYLEAHRDRYLDAIRTLARIPAPSNHEELRAQCASSTWRSWAPPASTSTTRSTSSSPTA